MTTIYEKIIYTLLGAIAILAVGATVALSGVPSPTPRPMELVQACTQESEAKIVAENGEGIVLEGANLTMFLRNMAVFMEGTANAPVMDRIRAYTFEPYTVIVAIKDQCAAGMMTIPSSIFNRLLPRANNGT
jgi:hypothetical protein